MTKKVLLLSATPRKGGNSDLLCDEFASGALSSGHSVEKILLKNKKINYCIGCGLCNENSYNGCSQKDDMEEILEKMISSDVIVMATPVYFYTMNAQMKTLIDRCCAKYTKINNKEFYFIATAADGNQSSIERTFEGFRGFTLCLDGAEEKGLIYGKGVWQKGDVIGTSLIDEALNMGRNV